MLRCICFLFLKMYFIIEITNNINGDIMRNTSLWIDGLKNTTCPTLDKNIEVDVLIIGGGITGISCGYHLIGSELKIAIVEANMVGRGVTSKTTGKLTYLQEDIYSKINKVNGLEKCKLYYESQRESIAMVRDIVNKNKINCNLEESNSYVFTTDKDKVSSLEEEAKLLKSFGASINNFKKLPNKMSCQYAIMAEGNCVFHPLKYLDKLKRILLKNKIDVYENTRILSIDLFNDYYLCKCRDCFIKAKKVVLALHYPYFIKPFFMPFKVHLEKSYIGVSKGKENYKFNAISKDDPVTSIRYHENGRNIYQIFLYGSRNIAVKTCDKDNFAKLSEFPFEYEYMWSNVDIMTSDYLPYIGQIKDNLYLATGYNTWGMTNGSLAGKVISDLILTGKSKYQELFDPLRGVNIAQLPLILGSNIKSFVGEMLNHQKDWYDDNIQFKKVNGKEIASYVDDDGKVHTVYTKCPHIGCGLIFNEVELTWDCPCHGSRFNVDGKCIEGPSNCDISYKEE